MPNPIVSREQWLTARLELLEAEKELTRRSDELARRRRELPWVRVAENYQFATEQGARSLAELFQGRSQLLIYHFMFGPDFTAGCPACSSIADSFNGIFVHLANHDVTLMAVSRAPLEKLQGYKRRMGWSFPWASSNGSNFNRDFGVSFSEAEQRTGGIEYNYRREKSISDPTADEPLSGKSHKEWQRDASEENVPPVALVAAMTGTDVATFTRERPGMSAFALKEGVVYHTYSAFARGLDALWGMYQWLDRAPLGRNEQGVWWRRHDEYEQPLVQIGSPKTSCCHTPS